MNLSMVPFWFLDLRRDAVEIARQQRNDAVAEPLRHAGEAGEIDEHHAHRPYRAAEARAVAVADQPLHQVGRNVFPERGKPLRHVADRAGEILDLGQPRRMPLHLVEIETLDMPDLAHHLDQGCCDQALGEPRRQQPCKHDQHRKADQQIPDRHLHRPEKFRFRHHRHQRPARKRNRRQHRLIGLAVPRHLVLNGCAFAGFVGAAGVLDRFDRDRKQRMIGFQRHHLVGVRIGCGDHLAVPLEDEGAGRFSDRELRQEIRDPRQFDDDGDDAGGLLIDVDRGREGRRQPFAAADASSASTSVRRWSLWRPETIPDR